MTILREDAADGEGPLLPATIILPLAASGLEESDSAAARDPLPMKGEPDVEDADGDGGNPYCDLDPARSRFLVGFGRNEGGLFEAILTEVSHGRGVDSYYG